MPESCCSNGGRLHDRVAVQRRPKPARGRVLALARSPHQGDAQIEAGSKYADTQPLSGLGVIYVLVAERKTQAPLKRPSLLGVRVQVPLSTLILHRTAPSRLPNEIFSSSTCSFSTYRPMPTAKMPQVPDGVAHIIDAVHMLDMSFAKVVELEASLEIARAA